MRVATCATASWSHTGHVPHICHVSTSPLLHPHHHHFSPLMCIDIPDVVVSELLVYACPGPTMLNIPDVIAKAATSAATRPAFITSVGIL